MCRLAFVVITTAATSAAAQAHNTSTPRLRGGPASALGQEKFVNETQTGVHSALLATSGNDPCFIHAGCGTGAGYSDSGSMGPGWYCTDDKYVDSNTKYDACAIHPGCSSGAKFQAGTWTCSDDNHGPAGIFDSCYIHEGCSAAGYSGDNTASLGNGWYCLDGKYVDANTHFDHCMIHKQCSCGVVYKGFAWVCAC